VREGIRFLQDLTEIVIDPKKCPNAAREFSCYEYERDAWGNYRADCPDKNNHLIDAARYALEDMIRRRGAHTGLCQSLCGEALDSNRASVHTAVRSLWRAVPGECVVT